MKFLHDSGKVYPTDLTLEKLKNLKLTPDPKIYDLCFNPIEGYYLLEKFEKFGLPTIYGKVYKRVDKIINTYQSKDTPLGVICQGNKGSGKSLLTKVLANKFIDDNKPVILVSSPHHSNDFFNFLNKIGECLIIFDEFEKVYDKMEHQNPLLTFLDGNNSEVKHCTIISINDKGSISNYMKDRPSRFYYSFEYDSLEDDVIREYLDKNLIPENNNTKKIDEIEFILKNFRESNFDILQAFVEEVNRYPNENLEEIVKDLNITYYGSSNKDSYKVTLKINNVIRVPEEPVIYINPYKDNYRIYFELLESETDDEDDKKIIREGGTITDDIRLSSSDLVKTDHNNFYYKLKSTYGDTIVKLEKTKSFKGSAYSNYVNSINNPVGLNFDF